MSACANPLHSASAGTRNNCAFSAKRFLFPGENLNNCIPRCRCCRHVLPWNSFGDRCSASQRSAWPRTAGVRIACISRASELRTCQPVGAGCVVYRTDGLLGFVIPVRYQSIASIASDKSCFQNRRCPARNARLNARRTPTSRLQHSDYSLMCGGLL